ncbi:tetratricopeptide repeat protein [Alienimonas californiensis]|uniref:Tetratricopeptide repeat protein n=1 Tax=Alienimonas californiensis TaxID=2527989 RepID=A0A517P9K9_9PLAN|nr:hypothetical protein [Alienimonas californiensis]QDT16059.1 hypothetical protein CA12_21570 [Alienimonas californiensis]
MNPLLWSRPLFAAAALSAVAWGLTGGTAEAQRTGITGSLPDSHPMKDGGTGEGAFGATGSFSRGGGLGGFGGSLSGGGFSNGGGFYSGGLGYRGVGYRGLGYGYGYGGLGYGYGGPAYYPYGIGNYANPVVGLGPGGAYLAPGPVPYYGYGLNLGTNYLGYPAYGGNYTNFGGNPNAFMMGPHRNPGFGWATGGGGAAIGPELPAGAGPNPALDEAWREQADRWRAPIDLGDAGPAPNEPRPADERELAEALRDERAGDEAFGRLDYRKALAHYRRAAASAPTRGEPLYRAAFARVALGQFVPAAEDLRRALSLNPSLPETGPSLRELFGSDHSIARTAALGGVADWTRQDVRDPDRLFLLGAVMHANDDDRAREIFEAAWRLTGGRPHLRPYLDPVQVEYQAPAPTGSMDQRAADDGAADDLLIGPPPTPAPAASDASVTEAPPALAAPEPDAADAQTTTDDGSTF